MIDPHTLLGRWSLRRRLVDRGLAQFGTVTGTLVIEPDAEGLTWTETGDFVWGGQVLPVSRRLLLREGPDGWWMRFADGRPFHPWQPGEWVSHPCAADLYRGFIRSDGDRLRVLWDVTGPTKSHRIVTRCTKLLAG